MRVFAQCAAAACLVAAAVTGPIAAQTKDPAAVLAAAREALGGEKKLTAVKSFTATGRTRQVRGDNLVPIEFEIFVELPDKYLRKDEIPAQESGPTASGFNGEEWLQDPPPPATPAPPPAAAGAPAPAPGGPPGAAGAPAAPGRGAAPAGPAGPPRNPAAARVTALKQDFARLTLGMFAASFASYPMTFSYVGEAEAPQGKADVVDAKGPNNFTIRLFVHKDTHLPIMVSWTPPAPPGRGAGPGPGRGAMPGAPPGAGAPPGTSAPPGATPPGATPPGATARGATPPGATPPAGGPPSATPPGAAPPATVPSAAGPPPGPPQAGAPPAGQQRPPAGAGQAAPPAGERGAAPGGGRSGPQAPVENRLYFADYRDVDGMQFPFRLRRAVGTDTVEETTFDRYKVNAKIDPKKFEVRKPQ